MSDIESQTTFLDTVEDDDETITTVADESVATKGTRGKPTRVRDLPDDEAEARIQLNARVASSLTEDVAGFTLTNPSFTLNYDDANVTLATQYFSKTFTLEELAEKLAILTIAAGCEKFMKSTSAKKTETNPATFMKNSCAKAAAAKTASGDMPEDASVKKTPKSTAKSAKTKVAVIE